MKEFITLCIIIAILVRFNSSSTEMTKFSPPQETARIINDTLSIAKKQNPYDMEPWASERLTTPTSLPNCPWVTVIEWRAPTDSTMGGPSNIAQKVLGKACQKAVQAFPRYVKIHKFNVTIDSQKFHESLCLMPALEEAEGFKIRNLNDSKFRFKDREKYYDEFGNIKPIWGYTNFHNDSIYMRNDILNEDGSVNKKTVTVFVHELYHAMSWKYHVNDIYHDARIEENMAVKFTEWLHYGT